MWVLPSHFWQLASWPYGENTNEDIPTAWEDAFEVDDDIAALISLLNSHGYHTIFSCAGHVDSESIQPGYISFLGRHPELLKLMDDNFVKRNRYISYAGYTFSCIHEVSIIRRSSISDNESSFDPNVIASWTNSPYMTIVRFAPPEFDKYILMGECVPVLTTRDILEYRNILSAMHYRMYMTVNALINQKEASQQTTE